MGSTIHTPAPWGLGRSRAVLGRTPGSTEQAAPALLGKREAVWGNAGTGGALWHEQQHCLTNQFGDMGVVKLLHAGSLSQELLNVSGGEDVR